jgi:hypothetical protein
MNTQDIIKATGRLHVVLKDESGSIKEEHDFKNLVVLAGRAFIASRMVGTASAVMSHMAVGTGTVAAASGDTALGAEIASSRIALTSGNAASNVVTYVATFNAGVGTGAVTEAGVFNAASSGTMLCRVVFPVVNKAAGDTMSITWTVTLS